MCHSVRGHTLSCTSLPETYNIGLTCKSSSLGCAEDVRSPHENTTQSWEPVCVLQGSFVSLHQNFLEFREASKEICLSEGSAGASQKALRGLSEGSAGSLRGSAGVRGIFGGFSGVVTLCLWPSGTVGELCILGGQKLTWSKRDIWKTNLPFLRLIRALYLRGENCLQNAHFYKPKGSWFKRPLNWTGSICPLLKTFSLFQRISWLLERGQNNTQLRGLVARRLLLWGVMSSRLSDA